MQNNNTKAGKANELRSAGLMRQLGFTVAISKGSLTECDLFCWTNTRFVVVQVKTESVKTDNRRHALPKDVPPGAKVFVHVWRKSARLPTMIDETGVIFDPPVSLESPDVHGMRFRIFENEYLVKRRNVPVPGEEDCAVIQVGRGAGIRDRILEFVKKNEVQTVQTGG